MPEKLLFILSKIVHRLSGCFKTELKKEGITLSPGQIGILLVLYQTRKTTMGELSQALEMDNSATTRLVGKLEQQKIVTRGINPDDRRKILISLTDKGLEWGATVNRISDQVNRKMVEGFSKEEIEIFETVSQGILEKFE